MSVLQAIGSVLVRIFFVAMVLMAQLYLLLVLLQNRYAAAARQLEEIFRNRVYLRLQLPRPLQKLQPARLLPGWLEEWRLRRGKLPARSAPLLPAEQERQCPYYARTGQLVCDVERKMPLDRWYQPEDWVRDVVAGVADEQLLVQPVKLEESQQEKDKPEKGKTNAR